MTAQEKAKELVDKFGNIKHWQYTTGYYVGTKMTLQDAKQCAIICIDEMIVQNGELYLNGIAKDYYMEVNGYLFHVKAEIEKL